MSSLAFISYLAGQSTNQFVEFCPVFLEFLGETDTAANSPVSQPVSQFYSYL